ncbi:MAG TPA: bifunctional riboflavin kinase/FAD synthetase [Actinomycetota bacterium]|nr:bifunctional riboflavin kinase/FAD synthetase [Actinomycetota bacterium]
MKVAVGLTNVAPASEGAAVTIGTFDGVHLGHRALIAQTTAAAQARSLESVVVTWDRHPLMTLRPEIAPPLLSSPERKMELLATTGVDRVVVIPFTEELSRWSPERFVDEVLVQGLSARAVFVGEGWRFGHKRAGDVELLQKLGEENGFVPTAVDLSSGEGATVSSSRIREAVAHGDVDLAERLLGRPFDLDGEVIHGDDRGTELGFPTANIDLDPQLAHPARGVYAGRARVGETWFAAATNVGVNPTFGGDPEVTPVRVETFLLDFSGDLYGQVLRVEFWARLRDELRFTSVEDLIAQMHRDVEATRRLVL